MNMLSEEKQIEMRVVIEDYMRRKPQSINYIATQIEISPHSLRSFLRGERVTFPHTLGKIRNYLIAEKLLKESRDE